MSRVDERDAVFASPLRARSLFTVAAAICFARFVEVPRSLALSLMCSYWRSRLVLQVFCGMWNFPPWLVTLGGNTTYRAVETLLATRGAALRGRPLHGAALRRPALGCAAL